MNRLNGKRFGCGLLLLLVLLMLLLLRTPTVADEVASAKRDAMAVPRADDGGCPSAQVLDVALPEWPAKVVAQRVQAEEPN